MLGTKPPSDSTRRELYEALHSKWDGVQVTAARVVAAWGDKESLAAVRAVLFDLAARPGRSGSTGAVADALLPHISGADMEWIFEVYFERCMPEKRYVLLGLFSVLPLEETMAALEARDRRTDQNRKDIQYARNCLRRSAEMRARDR